MRLLRYVQPPTQAGDGDTVFPAMFTPFKLIGAASTAVLTGAAVSAIAYSIVHQAADLSTVLGAWGAPGVAGLAETEICTFSPTALFGPANAIDITLGAAVSFSFAAPIPADLWVMPGERLIFRAGGVDAADAITSLVWSILIP